MTIQLILSVDPNFTDSSIKVLANESGSFASFDNCNNISSVITSHTPSEATIQNLSFSVRTLFEKWGVEVSPHFFKSLSPNDLEIARIPPSLSSIICPPSLLILFNSSSSVILYLFYVYAN